MAILVNCYACGREFSTSASGLGICDNCNGVNAAKAKEKERWRKLSQDQKIEELLARIESLENHECNPCIG